jgi:hypothetical protein
MNRLTEGRGQKSLPFAEFTPLELELTAQQHSNKKK